MNFCSFVLSKTKQTKNIIKIKKCLDRKETEGKLRAKLIMMLNGNSKKADELFSRAKFADSGKSNAYYYYKAIVNLKDSSNK